VKQELAISTIRLDGGTHHRAGINYGVIREYAYHMLAGALFPPIKVFFDGGEYWLADGFLRVGATTQIGKSVIETFISQGSCRDAIFYATSNKEGTGLPHNHGDDVQCVRMILNDNDWAQMGDKEIANHCGTSEDLVRILRKNISVSR
jgi:hypothetical protein